jgi:hypothetical protein
MLLNWELTMRTARLTTWEGHGSPIRLVTLGSALLLACWCVAPEARAASTFSAQSIGLFQGGGVDQDAASAATPVTVTSTINNGNGQIEAKSLTDRGFLSLSGFVNGVNSKGTSGTLGMFIEFQDVTIQRIDGAPSTENVTVTFQYFTSFSAAWSGPVPTFAGFSAADFTATAQITQGATSFSESDQYKKDYFAGNTGTPGLESIAGTVQAGVPFTLRVSISSGGLSARTGNSGQYDMSINVGPSSLAPPSPTTIGSIFLLPAGFTVDSPEMNVTENQWPVVAEPAALSVMPLDGLTSSGYTGGGFTPSSMAYTLTNTGDQLLEWTAGNAQPWVTLDSLGGTLAGHDSTTVMVSINSGADSLAPTTYNDTVTFTNTTNGAGDTSRSVSLTITTRPGDVDGDGHVDVVDLLYLVDAFGSVTGDANYDPRCDFNGDGSVDVVDLLILVENFGL